MLRQRLLSTDVLPLNSSDHPVQRSSQRLKSNRVHVPTQTSTIVTINKDLPIQEHQFIPSNHDYSRQCCIPTTVTPPHSRLQSILPIFPVLNEFDEFYPLLTNIPNERLSTEESFRHQMTGNDTALINDNYYLSNNELRQTIESHVVYFSHCWNVDRTLLIVNINRLFAVLHQLRFKSFVDKRQQQKLYEFTIDEWFIILEYYLQMDVECFFMKTNPFRHAQSGSVREPLFSLTVPESKYGMQQCRDKSCRFCYERVDLTHRFEPAMNFSTQQIHRFINTYSVYLNCNVTCTTSNVIYALTCPCHQYDYIGRCNVPFRDRMWQHRMNGCRIMSNCFLGQAVVDRLQSERPSDGIIKASHIKLYQHSTQCPVALGIFLKCHPAYWCFVPMTMEQSMIDDVNVTCDEASILMQHTIEQDHPSISTYHRDAQLIHWCLDHLPKPPQNYRFSIRQRIEQFSFFKDRTDLYLSRFLDLYNASIVIAVPEQCSDDMRLVIHALLVAYTEPKLNIMTDSIDLSSYSHDENNYWCQHLVHSRRCSS